MDSKLMTVLIASIAAGLAGTAISVSAATATSPQVQHYGRIAYLTGGIGKSEAEDLQARMSKYPLAVEMFEKRGKRAVFTADADVKIADSHGQTVFDAKADGPFMLIDLPKGKYTVEASLNHTSLTKRAVHVEPGHATRALFEFPSSAD